jgi:hypothetical protein
MPSETFTIQHLVVGLLIELEKIWKELITEHYVTQISKMFIFPHYVFNIHKLPSQHKRLICITE